MTDTLNFDDFFGSEALQSIWESKIRNGQARGRDGLAPSNIGPERAEELITDTAQMLSTGTYSVRPYKETLKSKGAHKYPRIISIPNVQDRLVLVALARYLRAAFPKVAHPRPQPLVVRIRQALRSQTYADFIRLDVQNFYPSIAHAPLLDVISKRITDARVTSLIENAITTPTLGPGHPRTDVERPIHGVPVGTAIANVAGEIALSHVDEQFEASGRWAYFRYVDDILVLTPHGDRREARATVSDLLKHMGLLVHPKKTQGKSSAGKLHTQSFEYLGYTFGPSAISVSRARRARLVDHIARPITAFRRGLEEGTAPPEELREKCRWWLDLRVTGCYWEGARRGWVAYYSQIDDVRVLHELDGVVQSLLRRIPIEWRFEPKSFVRAWTLLRDPGRDKAGYIPNFDASYSDEEMRALLRRAGRPVPGLGDDALKRAFRRFLDQAVGELEQDVWALS